ncbi:hypothetical protein [Thiocapsa marina]|uniref:hypothetical protein n=1 Tax=Thiocapsa marina TaxID=244573 RepID=UPI0005943847|nr:hypothetical protein [Thiocapsa marina]
MNPKSSLKAPIIAMWIVASIAVSFCVYGSPISVIGIDITMSREEIQAELENRGFKCSAGGTSMSCEKVKGGTVEVAFSDDGKTAEEIRISCWVIGICEHDLDDAAQMMVDQVNVQQLHRERRSTWASDIPLTFYCGRGEEGDK